jgi:hypothetical protein
MALFPSWLSRSVQKKLQVLGKAPLPFENVPLRPVGKSQGLGAVYGGQAVGGMMAGGMVGPMPLAAVRGAGNANVGAPQQGTRGRPSDARFRSFAERFMIARAHLFRADPPGLAEDTWTCILDAKRAYHMIERTGQNIEPNEGAGF